MQNNSRLEDCMGQRHDLRINTKINRAKKIKTSSPRVNYVQVKFKVDHYFTF